MSDSREMVVETFSDGCEIIREERTAPDIFYFVTARGRMESFESRPAAQLYADIYTIVGGFTEKQTGQRGIPPTIARAREGIRITYMAVQQSIPYAAEAFEIDETAVRDIVDDIHAQAEDQRSQDTSDV